MKSKKEIRREILDIRSGISDEQLEFASEKIFKYLCNLDIWKQAKYVFAYMDTKKEIKTEELIKLAWKEGKQVALPRVHGDNMSFFEIHDFSDCEQGYMGITEPKEGQSLVDWEDALVIVPGVAFDYNGNRIGYGKGYYDRYLRQHMFGTTVALAGSWQMVEKIPVEEMDVKMDRIVTEKKCIIQK